MVRHNNVSSGTDKMLITIIALSPSVRWKAIRRKYFMFMFRIYSIHTFGGIDTQFNSGSFQFILIL